MLTTNIKPKNGIIDFLGNKRTYEKSGIQFPIELDFHWNIEEDKRVTFALVEEWSHILSLIERSLRTSKGNHLSIGGGGDSRLGEVLPANLQNWVIVNPNTYELQSIHNPRKINTVPIRAIGEILPLEDNSIDTIDFLGTIDHVISPSDVLQEAYRVSKHGAKLIITVTNSASWYKKLFKNLHIDFHKSNSHTHAHEYTPDTLEELLKENNFQSRLIKTTYFLRMPILLENRFKRSPLRYFRHLISNNVLPHLLGARNGGIIFCIAESRKL